MALGDVGLLLQGIGSILLALVTAVIGLRATRAFSMRVEGPIGFVPLRRTGKPKRRT